MDYTLKVAEQTIEKIMHDVEAGKLTIERAIRKAVTDTLTHWAEHDQRSSSCCGCHLTVESAEDLPEIAHALNHRTSEAVVAVQE